MTKQEALEIVIAAANEVVEILDNDMDDESTKRADEIIDALNVLKDGVV